MPSTSEGLTGPGIEPKPEETESIDTDKGFTRALREKPGGDTLPASAREMGAANSPHRKKWVQDKMDEGWKRAQEQITSREDLHRFMTADSQGDWRSGIEVPNDSKPEAAPAPSPESTAEIEQLKRELTTTKASLSELEQHEAMQLARDELEEAEDEDEVHATLSELREKLPLDAWSQFQMESVGDGLLDPEELSRHENVYVSTQAFEQAQGQAQKAQEEADSLAKFQYETLEGEQKRLGLSDEAFTTHLQDVVEAGRQLGYNWDGVSKEGYKSEIRRLGALVAAGRSAYRQQAFQEELLGTPSSVEEGLTLRGEPVSPREEIPLVLDTELIRRHEQTGTKVDIAGAVMAEDAKSRALGDEAAAVYRQAVRASEAKQARARRAGF